MSDCSTQAGEPTEQQKRTIGYVLSWEIDDPSDSMSQVTEVGGLQKWYGVDIGDALYELAGAPLEENSMDGISTLGWLQEESE